MAEEFQESEVIFQDYESGSESTVDELNPPETARRNSKLRRKKQRTTRSTGTAMLSLPVNIPENSSWFQNADSDFTDDDDGGDGEREPPHVIMGRRIAGRMMAFSVCTGNGRTLKGRDLSRVRNSILRMTGFLET